MSAAELKEVLRQSHAEIEARLGASNFKSGALEDDPRIEKETNAWLSEKRAYETDSQNKIDMLDYKIRRLEYSGNKDRGTTLDDAYKLKSIKMKAQDQLVKIKVSTTKNWEINKQTLENLLSDAANY